MSLKDENSEKREEGKAEEEQIKITTTPRQEDKSKDEQVKITLPIDPTIFKEIKPSEKPILEGAGPEQKPPKKKARQKKKKTIVEYKSKMIKIDGRNVLLIPSGFEIKTSEGWKPVMMWADKIGTGK